MTDETPTATLRLVVTLQRLDSSGELVKNGHVATSVIVGNDTTDWAASLADAGKYVLAQIQTQEANAKVATDGSRATEGAPDAERVP